jgi:uncharacterized protein
MAQGASFNCGKAGTAVEKIVCADKYLSQLDEELAAAYGIALKQKDSAEFIKQKQQWWIRERDGCEGSECLRFLYEKRISELSASYSIYGQYFNYKLICEVSSRNCNTTSDSLKISKGEIDHLTHIQRIKVEADFVFANLHSCNFEGEGMLVGDRILVSNNDSGCNIALVYSHDEIHTVVLTPDQCKAHCGMRGSLDEIVLRQSMSASKSP